MSILQKGSSPLGSQLIKTHAIRNGNNCTVSLHQNGIAESTYGSNNIDYTFMFDFDLKFSFKKTSLEVKFEKDQSTLLYSLQNITDLDNWRAILKDKLNQRGFHEEFKAIKKIGKGNFASVYLVQKHEDGQKYAVKAFSKEAAYSQEKGKECLIKEIQIMRHLSHKNNMHLHQVFQSENSLYIIFELLQGGSLQDKIKKTKHRFKPQEIQTVIFGILMGLKQMAEKQIMHRDLKPENLLFRQDNNMDCVIADFGLAQFSYAMEYLFVRCGTPGYVAPQVINIKDMKTKYQPICDIFSLGLIFYLLLFGKSAFPGKNYDEVLSQNRASSINLKGEQFKKHGEQALDLLQKMLKKSPKERISAKDALKHSYFNSKYSETEMQIEPMQKERNPSIESPLLTSSNQKRKILNKKDSCLDFKMGKENLMTGKTETVGSMGISQVSGVNNTQNNRTPAVSKFAKRND